jgi:hypothetical protein
MTYYQSLLLTLLVFKGAVLAMLLLSWAVPTARKRLRAYRQWLAVPAHLRTSRSVRRRSPRRRQATVQRLRSTDWVKVFRVVSMVLFIAYPRWAGLSPALVRVKAGDGLLPAHGHGRPHGCHRWRHAPACAAV